MYFYLHWDLCVFVVLSFLASSEEDEGWLQSTRCVTRSKTACVSYRYGWVVYQARYMSSKICLYVRALSMALACSSPAQMRLQKAITA